MLTVLLPCYNEEQVLGKVIGDIHATLKGSDYAYEILIVDDGSTDQSASIAEHLGCRVIRHGNRRGTGASCKTGIRDAKGDIIVMLDADGTYMASDILKLLKFFPDFDQVNGARTSEQGTLMYLRRPVKWLLSQWAGYLVNQPIPDINTGLKAFKRNKIMDYLWAIPDGFSCVSSLTLIFFFTHCSVKYIPTPYFKRIGFSKFHPIIDTFKAIKTILRLAIYFRPLRVFLPPVFLLIVLWILKLAWLQISKQPLLFS